MSKNVEKFRLPLFADRLRSRMADLAFNQSKLSELSGVDQTAISNYLSSKRAPSLGAAAALAEALSCDLSWLAGRDGGNATAEPTSANYVGPVSALEKSALTKALAVLRSEGVRGQPDQALAASIDTFYVMVEGQQAELGANGGLQHGEGGATSSARRRRQR